MLKRALMVATLTALSLTHITTDVPETRLPGHTFEIVRGTCLDDEGNGRQHNGEAYYNYISYENTEAVAGNEMLTIFYYNPTTLYGDDILCRWDFVIK